MATNNSMQKLNNSHTNIGHTIRRKIVIRHPYPQQPIFSLKTLFIIPDAIQITKTQSAKYTIAPTKLVIIYKIIRLDSTK